MATNYHDVRYRPTLVHKLDASANGAAAITIAADADEAWILDHVSYSYNAAPTAGKLTISFGGTTEFELDITAAGPEVLHFGPQGLSAGNRNEAVVITLAAAGAAVTGKVAAQYR